MRNRGGMRALKRLAEDTGLSIWMILLGIVGIAVTLYGLLALLFPGLMIRSKNEEAASIGFMPPDSSNGALRMAALLLLAVGLGIDGIVWMEYQEAQKGLARVRAAAAIAQGFVGAEFTISSKGQRITIAPPGDPEGIYFLITDFDEQTDLVLPAEAVALYIAQAANMEYGWEPGPEAQAKITATTVELALKMPEIVGDVFELTPEETAALNAARALAQSGAGQPGGTASSATGATVSATAPPMAPAPAQAVAFMPTPPPTPTPTPPPYIDNADPALADQLVGDAAHAWRMGDKAMALQLAKRAHSIRSAKLGPNDPKTLEVARMIAMAEGEAGGATAPPAAPTPPPDPAEADRLLAQASQAWNEGRRDAAIEAARQAVAIRRASLGPQHPKTVEAERMLAAAGG